MKLLVLFLFVVSYIFPQLNNSLQSEAERYAGGEALRSGIWGVYAKYVESGKEIISLNAEKALAPASGLKIFVSSVGLELLGEEHRFKTDIYYDGEIEEGVLKGNLYIVGGGDPTFGSEQVKGSLPLENVIRRIVAAVRDRGIGSITGRVIGDDSRYEDNPVPPYYPYIDIGNYYGAGANALTINDNLYHLYFKPASVVGGDAEVLRTEPVIPGLKFDNFMKTGEKGSGDNGYIYNAPGGYNALLRGTIPAGVKEFSIRGSIPDPPLFAAQYITEELKRSKIAITGEAGKNNRKRNYEETKLIYSHLSPPLKDIAVIINKRSNNLYTELLLKAIGEKVFGSGSSANGIRGIREFLRENKISTEGFDLGDGSGLSRTNQITAKMMVELLSVMTKKKSFQFFYNSLSIAGDPGDIGFFKNFGTGTVIQNNARIKSGTINGVRSHSGYLRDREGRLIAFSFIANNFGGKGGDIGEIHKQMMIRLGGLK
jgi:serine-type D-Ala-D-Ala carboxypeptidase/endopeptidase (penicillin-binding protein 4)